MIAILVIILLLCLITFMKYRWESETWNGGYCMKHGEMWTYFDTDSHGERGYRCGKDWSNGCSVWIGFPGIDRGVAR